MNDPAPTLRTVMAPFKGGRLLLPGNVVAEVIDYAKPIPHEHGPPWLLGELEWNSWQVPIISLALLCGTTKRDPVGSGSRILILKTLTEAVSMYYIGVLINGLPKLKKLSPDGIQPIDEDSEFPTVFCRATLDDEEVIIPALEEMTRTVAAAVYDH
jgi:chemosensory pili system protein ChpC